MDRDADVVICGASFAGLAVARELAGAGREVLMVDRYEIGEKQTSACAAPTEWLTNLGLGASIRQTFSRLVIHTPSRTFTWRLPWTFSTFDYRELCALLFEQCGEVEFDTAKVNGRTGTVVHTDRGDLRAPLIVDALGWRRVLGAGTVQPPEAFLSRGLEVHPPGSNDDLELWLDPKYVPAGYSWSFPADDEVRVGVGSFDPRFHVKDPTLALASDVGVEPLGFQGNWIPHKLRKGTEDVVFFAGDSAGHCLPVTAEGIRTALYFGLVLGRELRGVLDGTQTRDDALRRYGQFNDAHAHTYLWMKRVQNLVGRINGTPAMPLAARAFESDKLTAWAFGHYLAIAPPSFALSSPAAPVGRVPVAA